jgi:hypothetical protein
MPPAKKKVAKKPAPKNAAKPAPTTNVKVVAEAWSCSAMQARGRDLYAIVNSTLGISRGDAKMTFLKDPPFGLKKGFSQAEALFVDDGEVWVAGAGLWRSTDDGASFKAVALPADVKPSNWGEPFHGVAKDPTGVVWAAGTYVVRGIGTKFERDRTLGDDARVKSVVATPFGVLLLGFNGAAHLANGKTVERLKLRGKGHLSSACVTAKSSLIVVGSGAKWSSEIYRSEDRGRTFAPVKTAKLAPLGAVAALPDGRVVAAGKDDVVIVSVNDGKTWKPLTPKKKPSPSGGYEAMCTYDVSVLAAGPSGSLLSIY